MRIIILIFLVIFFFGCATTHIGPSDAPEPKEPLRPFSSFNNIYQKELTVSPQYSDAASTAAFAKVSENFDKEIETIFPNVNKYINLSDHDNKDEVLIIEPCIKKIKFVRGAKRVFFGPLAGSSAIVMEVKFIDGYGDIIASPKFYQRAQAMGGAYSFGVTDNTMLFRIAQEVSAYIREYYEK